MAWRAACLALEVRLGGSWRGVFGLEVRLAGVWLGGAISKWDGQMFKILLPHGWLGGAISKWDGQMFKICFLTRADKRVV